MKDDELANKDNSDSQEWSVKKREWGFTGFTKDELSFDVIHGIDHHSDPYPKYLIQQTKNNDLSIIKNGEIVPKSPELDRLLNIKGSLRFTGNLLLFILIEFGLFYFSIVEVSPMELTSPIVNVFLEFFQLISIPIMIALFIRVVIKKSFSIFKTKSLNYYKKDLDDDNYYFYEITKKGFTLEDNNKAKKILSDNPINEDYNRVLYDWWLNLLVDDHDDLARMVIDRRFSSLDGTDNNRKFIRHMNLLARIPKLNYHHFVNFLQNFDNLSEKGEVFVNQLGEIHNAKSALTANNNNNNNNEFNENEKLLPKEEILENTNAVSLSKKADLIKEIEEEYNYLSEKFLDSQMNPETIIYKPLLLDVTYSHTAKMIKSFNKAKESMGTTDYENIDDLKKLKRIITIADNHFSKAETEAIRIGIPNINEDARLTAIKSLKIVLDINAHEGEKLAHWNNVLKIVRKTGMKEELINKANNSVTYEIKNKKRLELT